MRSGKGSAQLVPSPVHVSLALPLLTCILFLFTMTIYLVTCPWLVGSACFSSGRLGIYSRVGARVLALLRTCTRPCVCMSRVKSTQLPTRVHSWLALWLATPSFTKGFAAGLVDARLMMEKSKILWPSMTSFTNHWHIEHASALKRNGRRLRFGATSRSRISRGKSSALTLKGRLYRVHLLPYPLYQR